jgi:hypothetical protein
VQGSKEEPAAKMASIIRARRRMSIGTKAPGLEGDAWPGAVFARSREETHMLQARKIHARINGPEEERADA